MNDGRSIFPQPFEDLTNFELENVFQSARLNTYNMQNNESLLECLKNNIPAELYGNAHRINCNYYDEEGFNILTKDHQSDLTLFHMNIRKLGKHRGELSAYLSCLDIEFDVIVLTEIGHDAGNYVSSILKNYTCFFSTPSNNTYGGVAIYVKSEYSVVERRDLNLTKTCLCEKCSYESLWLEISTYDKLYIVGGIYRHPNGNSAHFCNDLEASVQKIGKQTHCILCGDMNINLLDTKKSNSVDYMTTLASYNFLPYITRPTRITPDSATIIDHIFLKSPNKDLDSSVISGNLFCDISDHLPNFLLIRQKNNKKNHFDMSRPKIRVYNERNIATFVSKIDEINWEARFNCNDDPDKLCSEFMTVIKQTFESSFPLTVLSRKRSNDKPWVTKGLRESIKHKNKLYRQKIKSNHPSDIYKYKEYKSMLDKCLHKSEIQYYEKILSDKRNSAKGLWNHFGPMLNGKKQSSKRIPRLFYDNKEILKDLDIANCFNNHFSNVGKKLAAKIPKGHANFRKYLGHGIMESFFLGPLTVSDVMEEILKLNPNKSPGPDGISPKLIKLCGHALSVPLLLIYNKSIEVGIYPDIFKLAKIIPIFKKCARDSVDNYRPISLLSVFNKIFERLIIRQLLIFLNKHKVLYKYQYGFREQYSTILALTEIVDYIKDCLDNGDYTVGLFIDLKKAFDTVDHNILLEKLAHYGIRGHALNFFKSYLYNRKQFVHCNSVNSKTQSVSCGVPQGSVLGPILFLIYVNDMANCIKETNIRLFADDTAAFKSGKNLRNLMDETARNIDQLQNWFHANKLTLNLRKTCFSIFHKTNMPIDDDYNALQIGDAIINRVNAVEYLGMTIDEILSWVPHVDKVLNSLTRYFGLFYRLRDLIPNHLKRLVYFAYIHSRINYGVQVYGCAATRVLNKLQTISNKLLKVFTKRDRLYSTSQLHRELKILKVQDIYENNVLMFVHRCLHNECIPVFEAYYRYRCDIHGRNTRDQSLLNVPRTLTVFGSTSVKCRGALLWNKLPQQMREINDTSQFKRVLTEYKIEKYN